MIRKTCLYPLIFNRGQLFAIFLLVVARPHIFLLWWLSSVRLESFYSRAEELKSLRSCLFFETAHGRIPMSSWSWSDVLISIRLNHISILFHSVRSSSCCYCCVSWLQIFISLLLLRFSHSAILIATLSSRYI